MGLDTVELLMAFEEEFGIHIDDEDAGKCCTPEDVADYVYGRVRKNGPCPSQKGFYKLRKIIVTTFNQDKIKPNSDLKEILGKNIKTNWLLLQKSLGTKDFPSLERGKPLISLVFILPAIIVSPLIVDEAPLELIFVCYISLLFLINIFTYNIGTIIPNSYRSVSSLIPYVGCSKNITWEKDIIIKRVIEITSEQLGIPVDKINKKSNFVHDLGAD